MARLNIFISYDNEFPEKKEEKYWHINWSQILKEISNKSEIHRIYTVARFCFHSENIN